MIGPAHHIGIAVRDLDAAVARYRAFGLTLDSTAEVPSEGVRAAFLSSGGARIELLEPLRDDSVIARFLEERGEGLHHLAFATTDIVSEMARLRREGFELIDSEPRPGAHGRRVAFIHPRSAQGVLLELVQEAASAR